MNVKGTEITEHAMYCAWDRMRSPKPFALLDIQREIARCLEISGNSEVAMRAADRLIQRERKAGNIAQSARGKWAWIGSRQA